MKELGAETLFTSAQVVNTDIQRYVSAELSRDRNLCRLDEASKTLIQETFAEKADGMFRWAYCQLQKLKKLRSTKPKYITAALQSLPRTLDATYERMLTGVGEVYRKEALVLLRWLSYAQSPLSLRELAEGAIIDPEDDVVDVDNRGDAEGPLDILSGLVVLENPVLTSSSDIDEWRNPELSDPGTPGYQDSDLGLTLRHQGAETRDTTIRLAHFSIKEYLESHRIVTSPANEFHLEVAREQTFLAHSCLAYITHYSGSAEKQTGKHDLMTSPLLAYSAHSWFSHSSFQESGDVSRATVFLCTAAVKHDWLSIHQPDRPHQAPFSQLEDVGSDLYYPSVTGLHTVAVKLLEAGSGINAQGGEYGCALNAASCRGHEKLAKTLIEYGAGGWKVGGPLYAAEVLHECLQGLCADIFERKPDVHQTASALLKVYPVSVAAMLLRLTDGSTCPPSQSGCLQRPRDDGGVHPDVPVWRFALQRPRTMQEDGCATGMPCAMLLQVSVTSSCPAKQQHQICIESQAVKGEPKSFDDMTRRY
ncbi:hypothetical protein LTR81_024200 [Elasticomyces elasticus]